MANGFQILKDFQRIVVAPVWKGRKNICKSSVPTNKAIWIKSFSWEYSYDEEHLLYFYEGKFLNTPFY